MTEEQTTPEKTPSTPKTAPKSGKGPIVAVILTLIIVAAIAGWAYMNQTDDGGTKKVEDLVNTQPTEGAVTVATVNGEAIYDYQLASRTQQVISSNVAAGVPLDEQLQQQSQQIALTQIVNETLLLQAAATTGMQVSSDLVEEKYQELVDNFDSEEEFQDLLTQQGITPDDVKSDITRQLLIEEYIDTQFVYEDIEVTEEEIEERYELVTDGAEDAPALEEVAEEIETQIRQEKADELLLQVINDLATDATVEVAQ
ncbi:MAG: SurA N-terminal domain-containing protein [Patescibacteria group bacterium]